MPEVIVQRTLNCMEWLSDIMVLRRMYLSFSKRDGIPRHTAHIVGIPSERSIVLEQLILPSGMYAGDSKRHGQG